MKSFAILYESRSGKRHDTGLRVQAIDKQTALAWARARGFSGKLIAMEVIDAECAA